MKKKSLCSGLLFLSFGLAFASNAQDESKIDTIYPVKQICEPVPVYHWSAGLMYGRNYFRVPPAAISEWDRLNLVYGASVDFTLNPYIGFGFEFNYNDYSRPYIYKESKGNIYGKTYDEVVYISENLTNSIFPYRNDLWRLWNVYGNVGVGHSRYFYRSSLKSKYRSEDVAVSKLGLKNEIKLSANFNVNLEFEYRQFDAINMSEKANRNCDAFLLTAGLRYKFGNGKKPHALDIDVCEYSPKKLPVLVKKTYIRRDTEETLNRIKDLEISNDSLRNYIIHNENKRETIATQPAVVKNLNKATRDKLKKFEDDLKSLADKKAELVEMYLDNVEFKAGSDVLTDASIEILNQLAEILKSNSAWNSLTISGNTDNIGSESTNLRLSQSRALSVKKYLISKGLQPSKLVSVGWGETDPIATNDTPEGRQKNRRVEFEAK